MRKIKIYNFQNIEIEVNFGLTYELVSHDDEGVLRIIIIRDPYTYFDALLFEYLKSKKSKLFTQDIINMMKSSQSEAFVKWLHALNFMPFYNPQIGHLNKSKKTDIACQLLESFDYVVPYEELELFINKIDFDINFKKKEEKDLLFSFKSQRNNPLVMQFIEKDLKLYEKTWTLWNEIKKYGFRPLR